MTMPDRTHLPSERQQYLDEPSSMRIGVACSGGGIRSAAFSLGALQALQDAKVLPRVEYVAAVSGGNYIASALAITAAESKHETFDQQPPWSHGSPEELNLRHHTDYLAPGLTGRLWLGINFVYGFIVNYLPFALGAFLAGRIAGWLVQLAFGRKLDPAFWDAPDRRARIVGGVLFVIAALLLLVALALVLHRRLTDGRGRCSPRASRVERAGGRAFGIGIGMLLILLLTKPILRGYRTLSQWTLDNVLLGDSASFEAGAATARFGVASFWLLVALLLAGAALLISRRSKSRVLTLLAGVGASGMLVVPFVSSFAYASTTRPSTLGRIAAPLIALLVLAVMAVSVHNRRYSMHLFYRERLSRVYAVVRKRDSAGRLVADPLPYGQPLWLSDVGANLEATATANGVRRFPKLVICCAVNVTSHDAPIGRFASSFTFEPGRSGSPLLGYRETKEYERDGLVRGTALTLPSIMAVSGAALSPMMGRFTQPVLRFLMALTNVRLGVWIPNMEYSSRHEDSTHTEGRSRLWRSIVAGWWEPGAWYVLREALGTTGGKNRFIYVSDGGHFENLGLVELIRRRCTHIICFDASLDTDGDALEIGRAIALARADLGAEIELDPSPTLSDDVDRRSIVAAGHVQYPDGQRATLIIARAVLTDSASWDLRSFSKRDRRFPNHSTRQQLFTDEQFQAYRSLGYQAGNVSIERLNLPPVLLSAAG